MKFQVAIAVAMLVSNATATCENLKIMIHEKEDCSDEGREAADVLKAMTAMLDKCYKG